MLSHFKITLSKNSDIALSNVYAELRFSLTTPLKCVDPVYNLPFFFIFFFYLHY